MTLNKHNSVVQSQTSRIKIICISDTHGQHSKLKIPAGDILIHAGDFMRSGQRISEIVNFNLWLGMLPHPHKIVIAGNHDLLFEREPSLSRTLLTNAIYLENSGVELFGLKFWGSPVQPAFNSWAFNVERGTAIRRYWNMIPDETDVLITHGPPLGILDTTHTGEPHLGCEELAKTLERVKPKLHIFGHIHGGHGKTRRAGGAKFVNASVLDERYQLVNHPQAVVVSATGS